MKSNVEKFTFSCMVIAGFIWMILGALLVKNTIHVFKDYAQGFIIELREIEAHLEQSAVDVRESSKFVLNVWAAIGNLCVEDGEEFSQSCTSHVFARQQVVVKLPFAEESGVLSV